MKKFLLILLFTLFSCTTPQITTPQPVASPHLANASRVVIYDKNGAVALELTPEEFQMIFGYSQKYIDLLALTKDEQALKKTITVTRMTENTYEVRIKANEDLAITATVVISNEELLNLRAKMRRLHETAPTVSTERLNSTTFKISMSIDDVKWSTIIDVESVSRRFDWNSFWMGFGASAFLFIGYAVKAKLALFFLL